MTSPPDPRYLASPPPPFCPARGPSPSHPRLGLQHVDVCSKGVCLTLSGVGGVSFFQAALGGATLLEALPPLTATPPLTLASKPAHPCRHPTLPPCTSHPCSATAVLHAT